MPYNAAPAGQRPRSRPTQAQIYFNPFDPNLRANPYPIYRQLLAAGTMRLEHPRPLAIVSRYAEVERVVRDHESFSSERTGQIAFQGLNLAPGAKNLLNSDPPLHSRLRRLLAGDFSPRRIQALTPFIDETIGRLLDQIEAKGQFDAVADLANQLPVRVIASLLGIEVERHAEFKRWSDAIISSSGIDPSLPRPESALAAAASIRGLFADAIEQRRRAPGTDLVSALVAVNQADQLEPEELMSFLILLLLAGNETTTSLIGNGLLALGRHREQLDRLRADASLIGAAIEEVLRYDPPVQGTVRKVNHQIKLGKVELRPDDMVLLLLAAANRDPAQFTDPDRFNIERSPNPHLSFGAGIHYCLGAPLARLEAARAIGALLQRFPRWRLADPEAQLSYKGSMFLRGLAALPCAIE
jgi:cytochrome P450